ncbi:MAG: tRNA lysidine(34) synthetase TilS [Phycisphaerales bacterium]|nr:tRNA lysidine(34) synthetase TilS [Phycisphaerales bacterium]
MAKPPTSTITAAWRRLSRGRSAGDHERRTLVACSGGADSAALLIVLAQAAPPGAVIAAHVVHDMRSLEQARRDADAVRALADRLGITYLERQIAARPVGGNLEAASRRLRYAALAEMARAADAPYVATAHHADDQLETMLMRLVRGAGPGGLAGIAARRRIDRRDPPVWVIRPLLGVRRADTERICRDAGVEWAEDATNADVGRVRSALRHRVLPVLAELHADAALRAAGSAELSRLAWRAIAREADTLLSRADSSGSGVRWNRADLRSAPVIVASEALRRAILAASARLAGDRITQRSLLAAVRAIRDPSGEKRTFQWRGAALTLDRQHATVRGEGSGNCQDRG